MNAHGRRAYGHSPVEPAFLLEEPYDQEGPDGNGVNRSATQPVRRFQWWGWLSTIGGYISGNGYVWPFRAPDWRNHLDTQGSRDMARLNAFIVSIPWYSLVPSGLGEMRTLITAGGSAVRCERLRGCVGNAAGDLSRRLYPAGAQRIDYRGHGRDEWSEPGPMVRSHEWDVYQHRQRSCEFGDTRVHATRKQQRRTKRLDARTGYRRHRRRSVSAVYAHSNASTASHFNPPPTPTPTPTPTPGVITIGETTVLSTADNGNGNLLVAQQATLPVTSVLQSMSFYVTNAAGKLRLGVYDASGPGGGPGNKVAETAEISPVNGWNKATTSPTVLAAGTYWLAYFPSSNSLAFVKNPNGTGGRFYSLPYGPLPLTFSTTPSSTTGRSTQPCNYELNVRCFSTNSWGVQLGSGSDCATPS